MKFGRRGSRAVCPELGSTCTSSPEPALPFGSGTNSSSNSTTSSNATDTLYDLSTVSTMESHNHNKENNISENKTKNEKRDHCSSGMLGFLICQ